MGVGGHGASVGQDRKVTAGQSRARYARSQRYLQSAVGSAGAKSR
jgi:hypothetical protein